MGDVGIEGRGGRQAGRQGGGDIAAPLFDLVGDAQAGVALAQRRDAQTRNTGHIAGGRDHLDERGARRAVGHRREIAVHQRQLFLAGHLRNQTGGARCRVGARGGLSRRRNGRGRALGAGDASREQRDGAERQGERRSTSSRLMHCPSRCTQVRKLRRGAHFAHR